MSHSNESTMAWRTNIAQPFTHRIKSLLPSTALSTPSHVQSVYDGRSTWLFCAWNRLVEFVMINPNHSTTWLHVYIYTLQNSGSDFACSIEGASVCDIKQNWDYNAAAFVTPGRGIGGVRMNIRRNHWFSPAVLFIMTQIPFLQNPKFQLKHFPPPPPPMHRRALNLLKG